MQQCMYVEGTDLPTVDEYDGTLEADLERTGNWNAGWEISDEVLANANAQQNAY